MLIGYARISTSDQSLSLQKDALTKAGCAKILEDVASGKKQERTGLDQLQSMLRTGDVVVVWRLDRLGRTLKQLIGLIEEFQQMGVGFKSLTESIDTTSPGGKFYFHIFAALAEFERNIIIDRTKAGLAAARARGKLGGRPKKLSKDQRQNIIDLYQGKQHSIRQICDMHGISKTTLYAYVKMTSAEFGKTKLPA